MKNSLYQYILHNADRIATQSFRDCHAAGVDSLLLMPGLRIFHANRSHSLITINKFSEFSSFNSYSPHAFPVAFHSHRTQLTISVLNGQINNWVGTPESGDDFLKFRHTSGITSKLNFERVGYSNLRIDNTVYNKGDSFSLNNELHTITVEPGSSASWLILEGSPIEHDGICYSQKELDKMEFDLYKPMSKFYVIEIARSIFLCS